MSSPASDWVAPTSSDDWSAATDEHDVSNSSTAASSATREREPSDLSTRDLSARRGDSQVLSTWLSTQSFTVLRLAACAGKATCGAEQNDSGET